MNRFRGRVVESQTFKLDKMLPEIPDAVEFYINRALFCTVIYPPLQVSGDIGNRDTLKADACRKIAEKLFELWSNKTKLTATIQFQYE